MAAVVAYRMTPRTIGYVLAGAIAFFLLSGALGGLKASNGIGGDVLFVAIGAFGVAVAIALIVLTQGLEVRAYDAGIVSTSLRSIQMIRWQHLDHFEVDSFRSSPFTVYAVLGDGSRIALEPLRGGSAHGARIEQVRQDLEAKLLDERLGGLRDVRDSAPWPRAPFGWRRRARSITAQGGSA